MVAPPPVKNEINFQATVVFQQTWDAARSKKYKLIVQEGSSRSSKTWSDFQVIFLSGWQSPLKTITVLRDTAIDCRDIVETEWVKWLSDPMSRTKQFEEGEITLAQFDAYLKRESLTKYFIENKTKHTWTFKHNRSFIRFTGLDDDDKVMGMTQNILWVNEPYKFPHEVYKQLAQRTTDFIIVDWNPKLKLWVDEEKKKESTIVLLSTFRDNPFCPAESKKQLLSYQPLSMCRVANRLKENKEEWGFLRSYDVIENKNQYTAYEIEEIVRCCYNESVNSASEYHWSVYGLGLGAELPNRIFHWHPITLAEYNAIDAPVYYYSDWGSTDPWAVGEFKYYDGGLYLHELNYDSENMIREKLSHTERLQVGAADEGIVSWKFNKLGIDPRRDIVCDNNRPMKIIALREAGYEYAIAAPKGKGSIIDGIDLLNNIRVYYTYESVNIAYEQEHYSRKVDRYGIVLEEPEDFNNHHMDGARMGATHLQDEGVIRKV